MCRFFVILEMEADLHTLIILGRPFLATARCPIDVRNDKLSFDVGGEFNLFKVSKFPSIFDECRRIDVIDNYVKEEVTNHIFSDPFELCILNDSTSRDQNPEVAICAKFLEASPQASPSQANIEELVTDEKHSFDENQAPKWK